MEEPDHLLWARVQADDTRAFEVLFERYADDVYNFCFRRTASWSLAQDLVSAVFLEAWAKRSELRITSLSQSLRPWLIGVAHNKIRNERRRARRLRLILRAKTEPAPDFSSDVVERLDAERRMAALNDAIRKLPRKEVDVLLLFSWGELEYGDIATILGIPVGTVRSRLARARQRMRELESLPGHEPGDGQAQAEEVSE